MNPEYKILKLGDGDNVREYALIQMPPIKAVGFSLRVAQLLGGLLSKAEISSLMQKAVAGDGMGAISALLPAFAGLDSKNAESLMMEAMGFETFAGSKKLSDKAHFDHWFRDNPGDLFPVGVWAVWEHSKDFLLGSKDSFRAVMGGLSDRSQ